MVLKVNYRTNICQFGKSSELSNVPWIRLIIIGVISGTTSINVNWAGWLLFLGVVFFSGSLYILALTQIRILERLHQLVCIIYRGLVNAYYLYI